MAVAAPARTPSSASGGFALLRLGSPALPIGGFSYSQGLENAIEQAWVHDEASAQRWIGDALSLVIGRYEAPLLARLCEAIAQGECNAAAQLHYEFVASRETAELLAETRQMGYSLLRLLRALPEWSEPPSDCRPLEAWLASIDQPCLPLAWALAARCLQIDAGGAVVAYLWAWTENQVLAAIKAVPLGQLAGQRLLSALQPALTATAAQSLQLPPQAWSNQALGLSLASAWHETQYSRLFRS